MPSTAIKGVNSFFPKVTTLIDATENLRIHVTDGDVNSKGVKKHTACALAVACKREFQLDGVIISRSIAYLIKGKKAVRFSVPPSIAREIISFDRGAGFAPGTYELSRIPKSGRFGYKKKSGPSGAHNPNKVTGFRHFTANARMVLGSKSHSIFA